MQGKRTKESEGPLIFEEAKLGGDFKVQAKPQFLQSRIQLFDEIKQKMKNIYAEVPKPQITIKLKDGKQIPGQAFSTTALQIAKKISKNLAQASIVARVKYLKRYESPFNKGLVSAEAEEGENLVEEGYELIDLTRPLQGDCYLQLISFEDKIGKEVFWHSSAHLLGQTLENTWGAWLCHGPPLDSGFFYDSFMGDYRVSQTDYEKIEQEIKKYSKEKQPYERIVLTKKEALQMFAYNPFKVQLIKNKIPEEGLTSAYRCGNLIDLCTGPHIPSADRVKGFKVTKNSSAYWLGKKDNDDLQRVYAISFPKYSMLEQYVKVQEELAKRDHRTIGPRQDLFNFTTLSPGCALFYPHGTIIYNKLMELMRNQYKIRGYSEVLSPNMYNAELWKISGHYFKYKENIYWIQSDNEEHGIKPMNCPGHCVMFGMGQHSYRDLPIRMADFGVLHRNEVHGALSGLTRVRRFQQDDAHIFCTSDQIEEQILGVLDLLDYIYSIFGFKYMLELSTRPEKYLGRLEDWDKAENQLNEALKKFGKDYKINPEDGAFYGPKIDVKLFDVFGREHQCGTLQLDFQLPARFNLQYRAKAGHQEHENQTKQEKQPKQAKQKKKKERVELTEEQREILRQQKMAKKKQKLLEVEAEKIEEKHEEVMEGDEHEISFVRSESVVHSHLGSDDMADLEDKYAKTQPVKNGFERPVIIHRAIFGSLERFIAILCEHTGGKWDFWVSPRQLQIIPLGKGQQEFAQKVHNTLLLQGYSIHIDKSGDKLDKKIRNAQLESYNFIGVIGPKEVETETINLRKRDEQDPIGTFTIPEMLKMFGELTAPKSRKRQELEKMSLSF